MDVHEPPSKRAKLKSSSLEDLNVDLVTEILCRLPYKEVVQCKCVCKNWFSLICNPQFVARFSSMNKLPWTFIYSAFTIKEMKKKDVLKVTSKDTVFKSPGFSLKFLPFCKSKQRDSTIHILKTYNDLVLCCEVKELPNVYYICNPLTRQWVSLPPTRQSERGARVDFIYELTKDNQKKHHEYGFKVVRVPRQHSITEIKVEIFSSEIGRWNEISTSVSIPDGFDLIYVQEAVVCNNDLIILGFIEDSRDMQRTMNINIIIFDIFNGGVNSINHCHHIFKMSRDFNPTYPFFGLHRMAEGGLRLARVFKLKSRPVIKIWELRKENNYEWKLMQEVYLKDVVSECEWVSEYYLKRTFLTYIQMEDSDMEQQKEYALVPFTLGFDPNDANILYLDLYCGGRMGKYNIQRKSLNIVNHTKLASYINDGNAYPLVLQIRPTPLPQFANHK